MLTRNTPFVALPSFTFTGKAVNSFSLSLLGGVIFVSSASPASSAVSSLLMLLLQS